MTEVGKKWANEHSWRHPNIVAALPEEDHKEAAHWLRAFCEEVEKRSVSSNVAYNAEYRYHLLGSAFDELKRELLGEK